MTHYPERNCLANALSPYLVQHSDNPVHWRQWGAEAFDEARQTGKPVLLSIGYAACHWCHVMAHESFENTEIADLMNDRFVNVKVDREERPDVDQIYMSALQAMGEQGGWPLTMFLKPDGGAFWGGTYFPPEPRFGRPGFAQVLKAISDLYTADPQRIDHNASAVRGHLETVFAVSGPEPKSPSKDELDAVPAKLLTALDPVNGGVGDAPKFPSASMWESLWRAWRRNGDAAARDNALGWARALCRGGIYDHLGGGLHRYTVDRRWLVPHFEKMLYDNAQFVRVLCLCYGATGESLFRQRIEQTVEFLLTDMRTPDGAFTASYDADSEGEEGRFYIWTQAEIEHLLGDDAEDFSKAYDVTSIGNWEGHTILNRLGDTGDIDPEKEIFLARCRERLLKARTEREPPARDDKVLADWNAMTIRALAEASILLDRPEWLAAATRAYDFVADRMTRDGRLTHAYRGGRLSLPALATDLACMINAAVALYAATAEPRWLEQASRHAESLDQWHGDGKGNYHLAASDRTDIPLRTFNDYDEAVPSATASIVEALSRLSLAAGKPVFAERAEAALAAAWSRVHANPFAAVGIINAADTLMRSAKLVVVGEKGPFGSVCLRNADPARIDMTIDAKDREAIAALARTADEERTAAYLCSTQTCQPPVFDAETLDKRLSAGQTHA